MDDRLIQILKAAILKISQMAYVEGANQTGDMLIHLNRLMRYLYESRDAISLRNEIAALEDLQGISKLSASCGVDIEVERDARDLFIMRGDILCPILRMLPEDVFTDGICIRCEIKIRRKEGNCLEALVSLTTSDSEKHEVISIKEARRKDECVPY